MQVYDGLKDVSSGGILWTEIVCGFHIIRGISSKIFNFRLLKKRQAPRRHFQRATAGINQVPSHIIIFSGHRCQFLYNTYSLYFWIRDGVTSLQKNNQAVA
jgi:hypothetical protein